MDNGRGEDRRRGERDEVDEEEGFPSAGESGT